MLSFMTISPQPVFAPLLLLQVRMIIAQDGQKNNRRYD